MGMSATAHLHFGVNIGEENPFSRNPHPQDSDEYYEWLEENEDDDSDDIGEFLARRAGLKSPYDDIPDEVNYGSSDAFKAWKDAQPNFDEERETWYDAKSRLEDECPVEIGHWGSYDWGGKIMYLKGYEFSAYAGDAVPVSLKTPAEEEIEAARKFCAANGLPSFDKPEWLLTSMYG